MPGYCFPVTIQDPVLSKGARTDGSSVQPKIETPAETVVTEVKPMETPDVFIPAALKQYPGIVAQYQGTEVGSAATPMKSPEPAFDIRNRDADARAAFDPRFDKRR